LISISSNLRVKTNKLEESLETFSSLKSNNKEMNEYISVLENELQSYETLHQTN